MPKTTMSFSTANKIINAYNGLLLNVDKLEKFEKYAYSDLQGYNIIDVSNALKICSAYRVFQHAELSDDLVSKFRYYAKEDGAALLLFFQHFAPDEIIYKIKEINLNDEFADFHFAKLTAINLDSGIAEIFNKEETPESFLNFCIENKKSPSYWTDVYSRIGIKWEMDENDRIYSFIKDEFWRD